MKTPPRKPKSEKTVGENVAVWFEIPASLFQRALAFYNHIYQIDIETTQVGDYEMGLFPANKGVGGAIVTGEGCVPNNTGPLVYLNGGYDLNQILSRVEEAGGRIVMTKTIISETAGYSAIFIDTEGNRLALHSKA